MYFVLGVPSHRRSRVVLEDGAPRQVRHLEGEARAFGVAGRDAKGEEPGSEKSDEEEHLFMASLSEADRHFLEVAPARKEG